MKLEDYRMLDPLNDIDLFCLLVITGRLTEFAAVHNNQTQSTAPNYSPMQLFHVNYRLLQFQNRDSSAGINISDIVQHSRWIVNVEPISSPLSEEA